MMRCENCGVKITKVNWALGQQWVHDPSLGRASDRYLHCKTAQARPSPEALSLHGPNTGIYQSK